MRCAAATIVIGATFLAGCTRVGPRLLPEDRFNYTAALSRSWDEQLLVNLVRLRYADTPEFIGVAQVVSSYEFRRDVSAGVEVFPNSADDVAMVGGSVGLIERPTITYEPVSGEMLTKMLLAPVPPFAVMHLIRAGYRADRLLMLYIRSINGVQNPLASDTSRRDVESFRRLAALFQVLQEAGAIDLRESDGGHDSAEAMVLPLSEQRPDVAASLDELRRMLGMKADAHEVSLRASLLPQGEGTLSLFTTSMLQTMARLSRGVQVPDEHIQAGLAPPSAATPDASAPRIVVLSGRALPPRVLVAVRHLGYWFWLPPGDFESKATFASISVLLRVLQTGAPGQAPMLTIPTR